MATLHTTPGSSTARQHQTLVIAGRNRGMTLNEIRKLVGGSLRKLSSAAASKFIAQLSGRDLANRPGEKPSPYAGRPATPGATRMITEDHVDQIVRLGAANFDNYEALAGWLVKDFKVVEIPDLAFADLRRLIRGLQTAQRAGEVLRVLNIMLGRQSGPRAPATGPNQSPDRKGAATNQSPERQRRVPEPPPPARMKAEG